LTDGRPFPGEIRADPSPEAECVVEFVLILVARNADADIAAILLVGGKGILDD
jgi:hypothetical protein